MRNNKIIVASLLFLFVSWIVFPLITYWEGTSENITSRVIAEPFLDGDSLVYRWSGDVVRSCPMDLRRSIVDSEGVVTNLVSREMGKMPARALGPSSYEISVLVPLRISEGLATYLVVEVPRCSWMQRLFPIAIEYPPVQFLVRR